MRRSLSITICLIWSFAWAQADSRLIFPDLNQRGETTIGIAVLNPLTPPAQVTFTARRGDGSLVEGEGITNPAMREVLGRSQAALLVDQIFDLPPGEVLDGWIEITSEADGIQGFFLSLEDGLERVDGAGAFDEPALKTTMFFPPDLDPDSSFLHLVNGGKEMVEVQIRHLSPDGGTLGQQALQIAALGKQRSSLSELFQDFANDPGYLSIEGDAEIVSYLIYRLGSSLAALGGIPEQAVQKLYSPQLATGPVIASQLQLANFGDEPQTIRLTARGGDGELLEAAQDNPREVTIEAGHLLREDAGSFFEIPEEETHSGWIEMEPVELAQAGAGESVSAMKVAGAIVFGAPDQDFTASLPFQSQGSRVSLLSHVAQGDFGPISWFTGLAMLNPNLFPVDVNLTVRDIDGNVTGEGSQSLASRERVSQLIPEFIEAFQPQAGGSVQITATGEILTFSLFGLADLSALAAIPTQSFSQMMRLDDSMNLQGVIMAPIILVEGDGTVEPSGDLHLLGDLAVLIETRIDSDFDIELSSPEGTVAIGLGNGAMEPAVPAGDSLPRPFYLEGRTVKADARDVALGEALRAKDGDLSNPDGGSIDVRAINLRALCDRTETGRFRSCFMVAGQGFDGLGATSEAEVRHAGAGGNLSVVAARLEGFSPLIEFRAGAGGQGGPDIMGVLEAYGANGGNGGDLNVSIQSSRIAAIDLAPGSGGSGSGVTVQGPPNAEKLTGRGGSGGDGGDLIFDLMRPVSSQAVKIFTPNMGSGGSVGITGGNGGDSLPGSDVEAVGGDAGEAGMEQLPAPGNPTSPQFTRVNPAETEVSGGNVLVETAANGGSGESEIEGSNGGAGGDVMASAGRSAFEFQVDTGVWEKVRDGNQVEVLNSANGGAAGDRCFGIDSEPGPNGGPGGRVQAAGALVVVEISAIGGKGGRGVPPGKGGAAGTDDVVALVRQIDDKSFKAGPDGAPPCMVPPVLVLPSAFIEKIENPDGRAEIPVPPGARLRIEATDGDGPPPQTGPILEMKPADQSCEEPVGKDGISQFGIDGIIDTYIRSNVMYRLCVQIPAASGQSSSGNILRKLDLGEIILPPSGEYNRMIDLEEVRPQTESVDIQLLIGLQGIFAQGMSPAVQVQGIVMTDDRGGELFFSPAAPAQSPQGTGDLMSSFALDLPAGEWQGTAIITADDPFRLVRAPLTSTVVVPEGGFPPETSPMELTIEPLFPVSVAGAGAQGLFFVNFDGSAAAGIGSTDSEGNLRILAPNGTYQTSTVVSLQDNGQTAGQLTIPHGSFMVSGETMVEGLMDPERPALQDQEILLLDPQEMLIPGYIVEIFSDELTDLPGGSWRGFCQEGPEGYLCKAPAAASYGILAYAPDAQVFSAEPRSVWMSNDGKIVRQRPLNR